MNGIPAVSSRPKKIDLPVTETSAPRLACMPLQFDLDTNALLKNDYNKSILNDIEAALLSSETSRAVIDTIFKHASINEYMHMLKVIVQSLPGHPQALNAQDVALLTLGQGSSSVDFIEDGGESLAPKLSASETGTSRLKMPSSLDAYQPGALKKYNPIFWEAMAAQEFTEQLTVVHSTTRVPGSSKFSPDSGQVALSPAENGSPAEFLGTMVHELSHARDYTLLGHKRFHQTSPKPSYATPVSDGILAEAEELFTTELKAWLVESMQQYLVMKAGHKINPYQESIIQGFRAGYHDIMSAGYNGVQSRLLAYIDVQLPKPSPTIKQIFGDVHSPLRTALGNGAELFQHYCHAVDRGDAIDADHWLTSLDKIFHTDFYAVTALGPKQADDLSVLDSLLDIPFKK